MFYRTAILLIFSFITAFSCFGKSGYMFRIELKDKGNPPHSIENPLDYLSERAIERRSRQRIPIDSCDLPIDSVYLSQIKATGVEIQTMSKWVKTVVVYLPDSTAVPLLENLTFVDTLYCIWKGDLPESNGLKSVWSNDPKYADSRNSDEMMETNLNVYGQGYTQINMLNGDLLHNAGFRGKGMSIGVLDVGFQNCDQISAFKSDQIKEVKNFTHTKENPLRIAQSHGTSVLSCMLSNTSGIMVGTAPEADYYLFKTEVEGEEHPIEEDYLIAAMEYADSIGIDVLNISLGYTVFDNSEMNHTYEELDGKTILASRAASIAGDRGMLLFISAGNEGNKPWRKITVPNDAENIITVAAIKSDGVVTNFSSQGLTADKRVKPDLSSLGNAVAIIKSDGTVTTGNGTSYASPILAGVGACLWQALPQKTSKEIIALMQSVGDRVANPDSIYGYGVPDMYKAYSSEILTTNSVLKKASLLFFDSRENRLYVNCIDCDNIELQIFDSLGQLVLEYRNRTASIDLCNLPRGIYFVCINQKEKRVTQKIYKW